MAPCPFCGSTLAPGPPWAPGEGHRLAYDPQQGRLWNVCPKCSRWTLTPLDARWETLEACEAMVRDRGRILLETAHLSLVRVEEGELIRVGRPPRGEFVDWRYGERLASGDANPGFWARLLARLPAPPVGGYDPYKGFDGAMRSAPWLASPFLEHASPLTYLFSQLPLAPACPSCGDPLALRPWDFQEVRFLFDGTASRILAFCAICHSQVDLELWEARPVLRIGLGLVTSPQTLRSNALRVAEDLDSMGGAHRFLRHLGSFQAQIGALDSRTRTGLIISLDEMAEMEALEAEWRRAEEMAAIMDGELSNVSGFERFREEILGPNG